MKEKNEKGARKSSGLGREAAGFGRIGPLCASLREIAEESLPNCLPYRSLSFLRRGLAQFMFLLRAALNRRMQKAVKILWAWVLAVLCVAARGVTQGFIRVAADGRDFEIAGSGERFVPWGFNYDHDAGGRLLEEYWNAEWSAVQGDFREMKELGANTVRIHLQVSKFMKSEHEPNRESLERLSRLVKLAERTGLYLDVTGLGCYDKEDVPRWYNQLAEAERWAVQARFWEAVAKVCRRNAAIFCYDLMNEPVITEDTEHRDWTPGAFGNRYFVQRLTLDLKGRTQKEIATAWVDRIVTAIRTQDREHMVTVGAIPWALTWPNAKPLFYSPEASEKLDFVSLHFYPKKGEVGNALTALAVYDIGKPIVIEEMFPMNCSLVELNEFIDGSRKIATGWIGFYWGKRIEDYKKNSVDVGESMTLGWLEYFRGKTPTMVKVPKR
jgi:hypothetical protein